MDLKRYSQISNEQFQQQLDKDTNHLLTKFKIKAKPWGTARKAINLFLRDALYNKYLSKNYKLDKVEPFLELPLDSIVAKSLKKLSDNTKELRYWPGLKHLTKEISQKYQNVAQKCATKQHLSKVHLDIILWTENRLQ